MIYICRITSLEPILNEIINTCFVEAECGSYAKASAIEAAEYVYNTAGYEFRCEIIGRVEPDADDVVLEVTPNIHFKKVVEYTVGNDSGVACTVSGTNVEWHNPTCAKLILFSGSEGSR